MLFMTYTYMTFTYLPTTYRDSFVYWLQTRNQSKTGTSLESDEFAGREYVYLCKEDEGQSFSRAFPSGLAIFLRDVDYDRRAKTEAELFKYYVA